MDSYATTKNVKFSTKLIQKAYEKSLHREITNQDYEGEVKDETSILKITSLYGTDWENHSGNIVYNDVTESVATLTTDQKKRVALKFDDLDKFESAIHDPENAVIKQQAERLAVLWNNFVLSFAGDVAAGNRVGTD